MRILQVTSAYYPELQFGGPPRKIHRLSRGLAQREYKINVVTYDSNNRAAGGCKSIDAVHVQYIRWFGKNNWQIPLDAGELIESIRSADLIHCYGLYNLLCPMAAFLAKRTGRPFVLEPLGMYVPRSGRERLKRLYHRVFTSWMCRHAAKVIATSSTERAELRTLVNDDRLALRRNGIDVNAFRNLPSGAAFRADLGIAEGENLILYIGRISPIKNLIPFVEAFHEAGLKHSHLVLVGPMLEPDYADKLQARIHALELEDRVLLAGPLYGEEKLAALAAADLFVLPSLSESYGNAAGEAVAARVPVLLTNTCGIAEIIHGRAGLSVPLHKSALTDGLRTMLHDAGRRQELTNRRADVITELSWEKPLQQTEKLYQQILRPLSEHPSQTK